ncbi:hypothetical protein JCM24511_05856 [Saitozyma sp. JCM 24511]|nr:hypothetical protein JCM24511_05856 [Saitozyma sp. JCM 24511]
MLLRLLPLPTEATPAPPTILFTLPLPTHPYTSRSLPLPPNLLAHRSVCLQEDIECPNVLLGEKSSWITGVVDDVTFSLPAETITVHLIDGSTATLPLSATCKDHLHRVCREVELSFAPAPAPELAEASPIAGPSSASSSKGLSIATPPNGTGGSRRSPSALLYSLISPLFPAGSQQSLPRSPPQTNPARLHRRQARSLLVDTYRRFVLPSLRERMPSAYLPWAISSETNHRMGDFETLQKEVVAILDAANVARPTKSDARAALQRYAASDDSDCSISSDELSDMDGSLSPCTPATSVFSGGSSPRSTNPQSFLLSIPPAHALPREHQAKYASHLSKLTAIASRINSIRRLNGKYEREEGKRRWLEGLERGRLGDRALKRAFSNGQLRGNDMGIGGEFGIAASEALAKAVTVIHVRPPLTRSDSESSYDDLESELEAPSLTSCGSDDSLESNEWDNESDENHHQHQGSLASTPKLLAAPILATPLKWSRANPPPLPSKPKGHFTEWRDSITAIDVVMA